MNDDEEWTYHGATGVAALRSLVIGAVLAAGGPALGADPARGAQLYMRTDADTRSCVSCHGPDPGQNHNNILRAADNPDTLTKVLNTVSAMGFLRPQLTESDKEDIAAFLGTVSVLNGPGAPLQVWPVTMDFGSLSVGSWSQPQFARMRNNSGSALELNSLAATTGVTLTHDCPSFLAPGGSCDLRLQWAGHGEESLRAAIVIQAAGATTPFYVAAAARRLTTAASAMEWSGAEVVLKFEGGNGPTPVRQRLRLHNPGPLPAVIGQTSITGPDASRFSVESGCAAGTVLQALTDCDIVVSYSPSLKPQAQAVLQLRTDQTNPASLRLEGSTTPGAALEEPATLNPPSGGGCSIGPPRRGGTDPSLALLAVLAAAAAARRHRAAGKRLPQRSALALAATPVAGKSVKTPSTPSRM